MVKVRAYAESITLMEWVGEVPDDIPADERWYWIKHNIEDAEFYEPNQFIGDWIVQTDVEVLAADESEVLKDA